MPIESWDHQVPLVVMVLDVDLALQKVDLSPSRCKALWVSSERKTSHSSTWHCSTLASSEEVCVYTSWEVDLTKDLAFVEGFALEHWSTRKWAHLDVLLKTQLGQILLPRCSLGSHVARFPHDHFSNGSMNPTSVPSVILPPGWMKGNSKRKVWNFILMEIDYKKRRISHYNK